MRILITGWAGFIGSNLTRMLLRDGDEIMGLDAMTYAARPFHAREALRPSEGRFFDVKADLRDADRTLGLVRSFKPERVYHLAAESHVCRSIEGPRAFAESNFMGTFNLLEALRKSEFSGRLVHISTDEAFGELEDDENPFWEDRHIDPRSPYAASKAASDLMVRAFVRTYGLDAVITRCTNNYGPNQHEEKLIPRAIMRFLRGEAMTMHGDGTHRRDWIFVDDHCRGLIAAAERGRKGEIYCLGSGLELKNRDIVNHVAFSVDRVTGKPFFCEVTYTKDRPTDDRRYAVSTQKAQRELGWKPNPDENYLKERLDQTVKWYMENQNAQKFFVYM